MESFVAPTKVEISNCCFEMFLKRKIIIPDWLKVHLRPLKAPGLLIAVNNLEAITLLFK